jgi:hypothetical protein
MKRTAVIVARDYDLGKFRHFDFVKVFGFVELFSSGNP